MIVKKELIDEDIKKWEPFVDNYETIADNVLVTVLAFYAPEKREEKFKSTIELLKSLKEPISGDTMCNGIKEDLNKYEKIRDEALVAMRTLNWVKEISKEKE